MVAQVGAPLDDIPDAPDNSPAYFQSMTRAIKRALRLQDYRAKPQVLLMSPNGSVYKLSVDNTGTLVVAAASKNDPRPPL